LKNVKDLYTRESLAREVILERQSTYISQLQDELKNAKVILQNKIVCQQYFKSLKEYKNEIEKKSNQENKLVSNDSYARPSTASHNRAQSSSPKPGNLCRKALRKHSFQDKQKLGNTVGNNSIFPNRMGNGIFSTFDSTLRSITPASNEYLSLYIRSNHK
jgi:hypothetical protein